jgi:hypothetical protein
MENDRGNPYSEHRMYRQGLIITDLIEVMKKHYESDVENVGDVVTDITIANVTATVAFICSAFTIPTVDIAEEFITLYTQDMRMAFEQYFEDINIVKRRK